MQTTNQIQTAINTMDAARTAAALAVQNAEMALRNAKEAAAAVETFNDAARPVMVAALLAAYDREANV